MPSEPGLASCHKGLVFLWLKIGEEESGLLVSVLSFTGFFCWFFVCLVIIVTWFW